MYTLITPVTCILDNLIVLSEQIFSHPIFLIFVTSSALLLKSIILYTLFRRRDSLRAPKKLLLLLTIILISVIIEDITWLIKLTQIHMIHSLDYRIVRFFIRMAWGLFVTRYLAIAFFMNNIISPSSCLKIYHKVHFVLSAVPSAILTFLACCLIAYPIPHTYEAMLVRLLPLYTIFCFAIFCMLPILVRTNKKKLPKIIQRQCILLVKMFLIPTIIMGIAQAVPLNTDLASVTWVTNSYTFLGLSNLLFTYMIFYCARKLVGIRFLGINKHVQSYPMRTNFIDKFKDVLEQMGHATSLTELTHIAQELFRTAFEIPPRATILHVRTDQTHTNNNEGLDRSIAIMNADIIISSPDCQLAKDIKNTKILIYDELIFNNFYEHDQQRHAMIQFLDDIYADIFIPIYKQQQIIGSIIIERNARPKALFNKIECDEMIVFASFLGNIINLLQSRNLEQLMAQEKEMREELYSKHQEVTQYKESIRSFLTNSTNNKIGIIYYRNRQFVVGNREAKEFIPINLNMHEGHLLTKTCKQIVADVQQYKSAQTMLINGCSNTKLMIYAIPHLENNNVTLLIYYPDISDVITKQIDSLKDPSQWDYMLYLETTATGKLIDQLIPGNGSQLLAFKIELLKTALSTKATLLDMPSEDLVPIVELFHHINMRSTLHTLCLDAPQTTPEITINLFGINQLFDNKDQEPLLRKLDNTGSLFIQNIHFLNHETQEQLAEFIHYGFFRPYKSDQKICSNVRIFCSSNQPLTKLVHENKFSPELFKELQKATLAMPPLLTLPEQEMKELTQGFATQALNDRTFEKILELNEREHEKIATSRPTSLQDLKKRVQSLLVQKSKNNNLYDENTFDTAYHTTDPDLTEIARLGKHALKDERAMAFLWNKFKNQNKIATFLGVNRSSVNRRCKRYKLL